MSATPASRPPSVWTPAFTAVVTANLLYFLNLQAYTLLPLYIVRLGGSEFAVGSIMATYGLAAVILQPVAGTLTARVGRKPLLVLGCLLGGIASIGFAYVRRLSLWLAVLRGLQGVSFSAYYVANFSLAAVLVPAARRAEGLSLFGVANIFGTAMAPVLGEILIGRAGFRAFFLATTVAVAAALGVSLAIREPVEAGGPSRWELPWGRILSPTFAVAILFGVAWGTVFVFTAPYVEAEGLKPVGPFFFLYSIAAVAVRLRGGSWADRLGPHRFLIPCLAGQAVGALLLFLIPARPSLWAAGVITGVSHGLLYPTMSATVLEETAAAEAGPVLGLFSATVFFGQMAGAFLFGIVGRAFGYRSVFLAMFLFLGAGIAILLSRWRPRPPRRPPLSLPSS